MMTTPTTPSFDGYSAIHVADQAVVDELKAISELKRSFLKKELDLSPQVTIKLAEIREQQSMMKTYEITIKKLECEIESKESKVSLMNTQLQESITYNKSLEKRLNASGPISTILENVQLSALKASHLVQFLHYTLRSVDFKRNLGRSIHKKSRIVEGKSEGHDWQWESIIEEAWKFTTEHLKNLESRDLESNLALEVKHALTLPLHWRTPRLEARWFIDVYERREVVNSILLEFAKLDFNIVQGFYQEELKQVSRWWKQNELGEKLEFARDSGYKPTMEEYMINAEKSIAGPMMVENAYLSAANPISEMELEYLESISDILHCISRIARLQNDLGTSSV
ncbi:hypothetical protein QYF36_006754 [Acer negundo]|nr:hypothetical protein QYF36_006754 [Acer negundo]